MIFVTPGWLTECPECHGVDVEQLRQATHRGDLIPHRCLECRAGFEVAATQRPHVSPSPPKEEA